jgi:hypothetical protein
MIRIAIIAEAFEAISATLPLGSVGYEHERAASGGYFIWLDRPTARRSCSPCVDAARTSAT